MPQLSGNEPILGLNTHGLSGVGKVVYRPYFLVVDLAIAQEVHDLIYLLTFYQSFGFDVEVELLQVCGPILMEIILQFSLCLHEL
jgi:hypothetical protein